MNTAIEDLFSKTKRAYEESDIKKYAIKNHKTEWYYSLSSTRTEEIRTLIVGFNWGVDQKGRHERQTEIPKEGFFDLTDLGSFKRVKPFLKEYLPHGELDNIGQTNFCFFRSEEESQISKKDLEASESLFKELLDIIQPKMILAFSKKLRDFLLGQKEHFSIVDEENIKSGKKNILIVRGNYKFNDREITVFLLPHPNSKVTRSAREAAWKFCFPEN